MTTFVYRCTDCGQRFGRDEVRYLCPSCGEGFVPGEPLPGVLEVEFEPDALRQDLDPTAPDRTRFYAAVEPLHHPPYPVGHTPLVAAPGLGRDLDLADLWIKNDGLNPSGSLKDRASFLVVAEARRLRELTVVAASTGNAASALAAVCASTDDVQALIFVPADAPRGKLAQMLAHGARVVRVRGTYDDACRLSLEYTAARGGLNRNTAYHPLTIEGKKTAALEIWAQGGPAAPDVVVVPVGDGVILAGVHKGFRDLQRAGLIERLPRLVAVQAESSDAIHHLVTTGEYHPAAPATVADSIAVAAPSNARLAVRAIRESDGLTVTVSDAQILAAQQRLARRTGVFAEPAAAAALAGLERVRDQLDPAGRIVLLITGHGLKDVDAALHELSLPAPVPPELAAVEEEA